MCLNGIQLLAKTQAIFHFSAQQKSLYGVDDVDKANMTCLMWACFHNNANITAFLLDKHADKEEKDIDGMTAMHW